MDPFLDDADISQSRDIQQEVLDLLDANIDWPRMNTDGHR
jgi:hypothetical protein